MNKPDSREEQDHSKGITLSADSQRRGIQLKRQTLAELSADSLHKVVGGLYEPANLSHDPGRA